MSDADVSDGGEASGPGLLVCAHAARAVFHAVGATLTALVLALPFTNRMALDAARRAIATGRAPETFWTDLLVHLGLASAVWAVVCIGFSFLRQRLRDPPTDEIVRRGSVALETVVVLPVLLLLIFGLGQLVTNNIASLVTDLATMEAGRTAWIWEREPDGDAAHRARLQAAAVLTPAAPTRTGIEVRNAPQTFYQYRGMLLGTQLPTPSVDAGSRGTDVANGVALGAQSFDAPSQNRSFSGVLGILPFSTRTIHKFTYAYAATEVDVGVDPDEDTVSVTVTYHHKSTFPIVGAIFGERKSPADTNKPGFYTSMSRVFEQKRLPAPNRRTRIQSSGEPPEPMF